MGSVYGIVIGALVKQRSGSTPTPQPTWIARTEPSATRAIAAIVATGARRKTRDFIATIVGDAVDDVDG